MAQPTPRPPYLQLLGTQVLGAPENVALGDALAAQLVDLHHAAEGDETHQGRGGQERQRHLQGLLQGLQVLVLHAGVHHVEEDQRHLGTTLRTGDSVHQADRLTVNLSD